LRRPLSWRRLCLSGNAVAVVVACASALGCRRPSVPESCLDVSSPEDPAGFDAPISLSATPSCGGGPVRWRQIAGPALRELTISPGGHTLSARTPPRAIVWSESVPSARPIPWGIVPYSPRTRGEIRMLASWRDAHGGLVERELRFAAADRSRGLPNTPVGARIHLGGDGWRLEERPTDSRAQLARDGALAALTPDVPGDWRLVDGAGRVLTLRGGRYADTPLDCGRSGCHQAISEAAAASPMTTVLARGMWAVPDPGPEYPGCALACHAVGDPGLDDGGFTHVARQIEFSPAHGDRWSTLPRPLRRLGGVGCLACHGPGALPEASSRWAILRSDVCASCHDAPPRYGHVAAWLGSAMARSDADPRAANDVACTGCHTTWGFLETFGQGAEPRRSRKPPVGTGPNGIACAACHAVHEHGRMAPTPGLLRSPPLPPILASAAPSTGPAVCLPCHTPDARGARPFASAASIWLGRGGLDPRTGAALDGRAPHGTIAGGCTGCHRESSAGDLQRGRSHGFTAPADGCRACHGDARADESLQTAARRLWRALFGRDVRPDHAAGQLVDRGTPRGRAAWNLLLVLEDRGAGAHNPTYARRLLDGAAAIVARGQP
jgi:hypothetical protein